MSPAALVSRAGLATHVGRVRRRNEDSAVADRTVFLVADGMGGHSAGDVASRIVTDVMAELAGRPDVRPSDVTAQVRRANEVILASAARHPEQSGMGTTLAGLVAVQAGGTPHWAVVNVGDSRVYRYGADGLSLVTVDHSEVQEMVDAGLITAAEAGRHPLRNVVTRSLGSDPGPEVDVWVVPQQAGERFVVCSDGLSNELSRDEIAAVLDREQDPQRAADELVRTAVEAAGRDNVTAIVLAVSRAGGVVADVDEDTSPRQRYSDLGG